MNFANISAQVKIIDTLKYYQTSPANLAATAGESEKSKIKSSVKSFLSKHEYFSTVWQSLIEKDQNKILDIIAEGKGAMPYEKITDINSLEIAPDETFFKHTEFYSSLNQTNISFDIYENMKYLYETLKIRNLGDMNDLYNVQDVIFLCEIIENRFQQITKNLAITQENAIQLAL